MESSYWLGSPEAQRDPPSPLSSGEPSTTLALVRSTANMVVSGRAETALAAHLSTRQADIPRAPDTTSSAIELDSTAAIRI
jgi:hypothetical protein